MGYGGDVGRSIFESSRGKGPGGLAKDKTERSFRARMMRIRRERLLSGADRLLRQEQPQHVRSLLFCRVYNASAGL